jgi:hypothetical protein
LGDQSPLTPSELLYQRLLARDPVETAEQARTYLKEKPLVSYYEDILLQGLKLAQTDAERGLLDDERMQCIRDGVAEIVDDLDEHKDAAESPTRKDAEAEAEQQSPLAKLDKAEGASGARVLPERWRTEKSVLCIPGLGVLDEAAAMIAAHLLQRQGIGAQAEHADTLSMSRVFSWETEHAVLVCLCYVGNVTSAQIRYAVRRVRRRAPDVFIVVALLGGAGGIDGQEISSKTVLVQDSLRATIDQILKLAHGQPQTETSAKGPIAAVAG